MEPNQNNLSTFILHQSQFPAGVVKPRALAASSTYANGDLYYSNGTQFVKLAIGTTGQILTVTSGVPAWSSTISGPTNIILPKYTTTQRNALTPVAGMLILNTSTSKLNFYDGTSWAAVTSV